MKNTIKGKPELFYWNKKEAISLLQKEGLQLPKSLPQDGFVNSIRNKTSNVKVEYNNVTETQQFKRWFGKSKVINKDGTPRILYHRTNADFTVFDTGKSGSNQGKTKGDGIYLSTNKDVSQWYYFIDEMFFSEYGEDNFEPYTVTINVKEKPDGNYVYSYNAEKEFSTRQTLHADVSAEYGTNGELYLNDNSSSSNSQEKYSKGIPVPTLRYNTEEFAKSFIRKVRKVTKRHNKNKKHHKRHSKLIRR